MPAFRRTHVNVQSVAGPWICPDRSSRRRLSHDSVEISHPSRRPRHRFPAFAFLAKTARLVIRVTRRESTGRSLMAQPLAFDEVTGRTRTRAPFSFLFLITVFALFFTSGCRTMEDAGKDLERAGEKIQDNAEKR